MNNELPDNVQQAFDTLREHIITRNDSLAANQARAWRDVALVLAEVVPDLWMAPGTSLDNAIAAIREMAQRPVPPAAPAVDWRAMYEHQTAMRYMDNNPATTLGRAKYLAAQESAALANVSPPDSPEDGQ